LTKIETKGEINTHNVDFYAKSEFYLCFAEMKMSMSPLPVVTKISSRRTRRTMADLPLAFVGGNPTEGEVGVLVPSSPLRQPIASLLLPDPYMLTGLVSYVLAPVGTSCQGCQVILVST
jgi:hypothetical protein